MIGIPSTVITRSVDLPRVTDHLLVVWLYHMQRSIDLPRVNDHLIVMTESVVEGYGMNSRYTIRQKVYCLSDVWDGGALWVCPQSEANQNLNEHFYLK